MRTVIKRYAFAILVLFLISFLMMLGTMGVKMFGDKMFEDSGVEMKPRGEHLVK